MAPATADSDAFVHISAVKHADMAALSQNQRVGYEFEETRAGKSWVAHA